MPPPKNPSDASVSESEKSETCRNQLKEQDTEKMKKAELKEITLNFNILEAARCSSVFCRGAVVPLDVPSCLERFTFFDLDCAPDCALRFPIYMSSRKAIFVHIYEKQCTSV